jgi:uncharacterized protein YukE
MWNYSQIKEEAKKGRREGLEYSRVTDLLVLAPQNDPFYVGTDKDRQNAEWFAELWHRFGYSKGVHLRRIHYQIVSQDPPVKKPNGEPYENTEKCWNFLGEAAKAARYLELVDPANFDDRRANRPLEYYDPQGDYVSIDIVSSALGINFQLPRFPDLPRYALEMNADQPYQVEIWTEKSTMNDVLQPLCEEYGINLVAGVGEMSITQSVLLMERLRNTGKPCRILYVSDFDPAGLSMPVAAARKTEFLYRNQGKVLDIELHPVVLTHEQCVEFQLPRTPIKETERRAGKFEERWGEGATELDALESLYPGKLREIVEKEILRFYDTGLGKRLKEREQEVEEMLDDIQQDVIANYKSEYNQLRQEYEQLREEIQERMDSIRQRAERLFSQVEEDLADEEPPLGREILPEKAEAESHPVPLFDSARSYFDQLRRYKHFQRGIAEQN